jgi:nucleoside-diphosphate-sugar epimerase
LNDLSRAVVAKKITILSDGTPRRPLIHIKDMARAIDRAVARASRAGSFAINAGSNEWNY